MNYIYGTYKNLEYQSAESRISVRVFIFLILLVWTAGIFIEFIIPKVHSLVYSLPFLKNMYASVCHQQNAKLIELWGHQTMVCARCTGIYTGGLASAFMLLFLYPKGILDVKFLLLAAIPMVVDVALYTAGIYNYSIYPAYLTGFLLGSVGILYIHEAVIKLIDEQKTKKEEN